MGNWHKILYLRCTPPKNGVVGIFTAGKHVFIQRKPMPLSGSALSSTSSGAGIQDEEIPFIAEVIKGGRLTIPEEIRTLMRIEEGNYVLIRLKVVSRKRLGKKARNSSSNGSRGT
jgi:hypothetical protein